jgi:hypothetical protein
LQEEVREAAGSAEETRERQARILHGRRTIFNDSDMTGMKARLIQWTAEFTATAAEHAETQARALRALLPPEPPAPAEQAQATKAQQPALRLVFSRDDD